MRTGGVICRERRRARRGASSAVWPSVRGSGWSIIQVRWSRIPSGMVVHDDLQRSRLTVFFRLLLAIPHLIWLCALERSRVFLVASDRAGSSTLITGRLPQPLWRLLRRRYVRYTTHVFAYVFLAANPFPGFIGRGRQLPDRRRDRRARAARAAGRRSSG